MKSVFLFFFGGIGARGRLSIVPMSSKYIKTTKIIKFQVCMHLLYVFKSENMTILVSLKKLIEYTGNQIRIYRSSRHEG